MMPVPRYLLGSGQETLLLRNSRFYWLHKTKLLPLPGPPLAGVGAHVRGGPAPPREEGGRTDGTGP